ncbi:MAG: hypothetical protein D6E12_05170 [Desulfovibrio sp.]|nr:MAG: hypothetical protein D6E12_05170 [Desulfovibrio sp.]
MNNRKQIHFALGIVIIGFIFLFFPALSPAVKALRGYSPYLVGSISSFLFIVFLKSMVLAWRLPLRDEKVLLVALLANLVSVPVCGLLFIVSRPAFKSVAVNLNEGLGLWAAILLILFELSLLCIISWQVEFRIYLLLLNKINIARRGTLYASLWANVACWGFLMITSMIFFVGVLWLR